MIKWKFFKKRADTATDYTSLLDPQKKKIIRYFLKNLLGDRKYYFYSYKVMNEEEKLEYGDMTLKLMSK